MLFVDQCCKSRKELRIIMLKLSTSNAESLDMPGLQLFYLRYVTCQAFNV